MGGAKIETEKRNLLSEEEGDKDASLAKVEHVESADDRSPTPNTGTVMQDGTKNVVVAIELYKF